jgi:outer membrane protein TolC
MASSKVHPPKGGYVVMRGWAGRFLIFFSALLSLMSAVPAHAQTGPGSPGATSAPEGISNPGADSAPAAAPALQGSFSGSVPAKLEPGTLQLSLEDAISRGLKQNLGLLLAGQDVRSSRGERWRQLSALLPNVDTSTYAADAQADLAEFGFAFKFPGVTIPTVVGPFSYLDSRAYVTQNIFDWKAINNTHAASENAKAAQHSYQDARDLVTLAVGYEYLQAVAGEARIDTADAQLKTAQSLYDQAADQVKAGTSPAIDGLRAQVEMKIRQQQFIQAKNDFAIQKLALARVIGLAPGQEFELSDKSPYEPFVGITLEAALKQAYESRSDFKAATEDVRAAEYSLKAARAGYLPSLSLTANYGLAATVPQLSTHGVFDVRGTLAIPIFQGGKVHGDVLEAEARLEGSRDHLEDLRAQIDADVRTALLNVESAEQEVTVAQSNIGLADQTLAQSRDRFRAGVTDTVEVVQAQEAVASAHENYISSLYRDNYAKISLARALGVAEEGVKEYFKGK